MILGSYPCCEGALCIAVPERTPAYQPEDCPHCGEKVWHMISRLTPTSWTEEDFLKEYTVDFDNMTIEQKNKPDGLGAVTEEIVKLMTAAMIKDELSWLYDDGGPVESPSPIIEEGAEFITPSKRIADDKP